MKKFVTTWPHNADTAAQDRRAAMERLTALGATPQEIAAAEVTEFVDVRGYKEGEATSVESRRMTAVRR